MSTAPDSTTPYALVVDDDAAIRMDVVDILEEAGFRTFDVPDGDTAVELLAEHHTVVTLLFTDVQMPGSLDGFALARETAQRWPEIAIVVASGERRPGPGDLPHGARFVGKPFSADTVYAHVQEILPDGKKPEPLRDRT